MDPLKLATRIKETMGDLPPMPHIAKEVLAKAASGETSAEELNRLISRDQALTSRVLRLANSSFYARARPARNVREAVLSVGFGAIRSLVLTASIRGLFPHFGSHERMLWEHSIGCGLAAKLLAPRARLEDSEQAYVAGLLHDVGKTVLVLRLPSRMRSIIDAVMAQPSHLFQDLEEEAFGFDHAALGQLMARHWKLDREVEEAIGCHHFPDSARESPLLAHLVSLCNLVCHRAGIGPVKDPGLRLSESESAEYLKIGDAALVELSRELEDRFASEKGMLIA